MIRLLAFSEIAGLRSALTTVAAVAIFACTATSAAGPTQALATAKISATTVLYDQTDLPNGGAINSQNYEADYDAADNQAADDFTVPAGVQWQISRVSVRGVSYWNPVSSVHVSFYKSRSNLPQNLAADFPDIAVSDKGGSFDITLPSLVRLKPGQYWVSVSANLDFGNVNQWGWGLRSAQTGSLAAWQNPPDGLLTGCATWGAIESCTGQTGPDLLFRLSGKSKPL